MRGKQSVKKGIWHIGGKYKRAPVKKRQKGGAIPLELLASIGAPILGEIAKPILGKILGRGIKKEREEEDTIIKMVKKHIISRKRANPKVVNLPNGRSFVSKWERISRKQLPINIKVTRNRTIGPRRNNQMIYLNQAAPACRKIKRRRRQEITNRLNPIYDRVNSQTGSGLGSNLVKAGFDLGLKALSSELGKKLINKGIDNIPNISKFGISKIKNKNARKVLSSEIADLVANEAQDRARKKYNSKDLFG